MVTLFLKRVGFLRIIKGVDWFLTTHSLPPVEYIFHLLITALATLALPYIPSVPEIAGIQDKFPQSLHTT
jgi:hypothetical protein